MRRISRAWVFACILLTALAGRGQAELFSVSDQDVIDAGKQAHQEVMSQYGAWNDPVQQARVDRLGQNLARFSTRPEIQYRFYLLNTDILNALATPDGSVHVTRGLAQHFTDDNMLSFVLGHEITHVELRHGKQAIEAAMQTQAEANVLLLLLGRNSTAAQLGINGAALWVNMKYSRDHEYQADEGGMKLLKAAGIDPHYGPKALQTLFEVSQSQPGLLDKYFGTHPLPQDRIPRAELIADKLQPAPPVSTTTDSNQASGTGVLRGKISVSSSLKGTALSRLIMNTRLVAYDENNQVIAQVHPNRQGYYRIRLPIGIYTYSAENSTLRLARTDASHPVPAGEHLLIVQLDRATTLDTRLNPGA